MTEVVIALGSNVGESKEAIESALVRLSEAIKWTAISEFVESEPMYKTGQPKFINCVAYGETALGPLQCLAMFKLIEKGLGRQEREKNGPREIDIDLIKYGVLELNSNVSGGLVVPHPKATERPFVVEPWLSIQPDASLPGIAKL